MQEQNLSPTSASEPAPVMADGTLEAARFVWANRRPLVIAPVTCAVIAFAGSYLMPLTYTAKTVFIPPQQSHGMASSALASLNALSGLSGGLGNIRSSNDLYLALLQSENVESRIIDKFNLQSEYGKRYRFETRRELRSNVRASLGKKDGLITLEADAHSPKLAADIANGYVSELSRLTQELALTEAQQRRAFFEGELSRTKKKLAEAQALLANSGVNGGLLNMEPKLAAEAYAALKAEVTAASIRAQGLRRQFAENAPEVARAVAQLSSLQAELSKLERASSQDRPPEYVRNYREYKYQEALFDFFSKQFETARLDESRDGATLQVVDVAAAPEYKSKPKRAYMGAIGGAVGLVLTAAFLMAAEQWRRLRKQLKSNIRSN